MEQDRQKEIIDKAWSYGSEDPYGEEESYQPHHGSGDEESSLAYQVSIQRQLNS